MNEWEWMNISSGYMTNWMKIYPQLYERMRANISFRVYERMGILVRDILLNENENLLRVYEWMIMKICWAYMNEW